MPRVGVADGPVFNRTRQHRKETVMRHFLSGQLHWAALAVGMLVLAGGLSVSLLLSQRGDGPAPALGAGEAAPSQSQTGVEVPGLPHRNPTGDGVRGGASPATNDASISDSAKMDAVAAGSETAAADDAILSGSPEMEAAANAKMSDSATTEVQPGEAAPPRGGPGDVASVQDSAGLVVRDASGNIKQQETVK